MFRIGRLAVPTGPDGRGNAALAACVGVALVLVTLSPLAARMALDHALVASLLGSLALAALLGRVPAAAAPGTPHAGFAGELVLVALFGLTAARGYFYDELDHHLPLTLEILRGHYPPPYPFLPQAPFRYHFGFDLLAAAISRVSGLAAWFAFDVLTVLAALGVARLASALAAESGLKRAAPLAGLLALVGGGLAWTLFPRDIVSLRLSFADAFVRPFSHHEYQPWQVPPLAGYLFQHPMALGMPLWLALLRSWQATAAGLDRWTLLAGVLVAALGLGQATFFYLAFPLLASAVVVRALLGGRAGAASLSAAVALGLGALGHALGAHAAGPPAPAGPAFAARWPPFLGWPGVDFPGYLAAFGVPLVMGAAGALWAARRRHEPLLVLAVAGVGGLLAPHIMEVTQNPWDTGKLFVALELALAVLAAVALAELGRGLASLLVLASVASPLLFLWVRLMGPLGAEPARIGTLLPPPAGVERPAAEWLAAHAGPGEVVLAVSPNFAAFSGVPSFAPQEEIWAWSRSTDPDGSARRAHGALWDALDEALLDQRGIAWVALGPRERARAAPAARAALADPRRFTRAYGEANAAVELYRRVAPARLH